MHLFSSYTFRPRTKTTGEVSQPGKVSTARVLSAPTHYALWERKAVKRGWDKNGGWLGGYGA